MKPTNTLQQWQWYLDTAGCSRSVLGALEDCDWWCSRLQGSGCLPGDRAMRQAQCVCVWVCIKESEQGHVRECVYLSETCYECQKWILCLLVSWHRVCSFVPPLAEESAWGCLQYLQPSYICSAVHPGHFFLTPINSFKTVCFFSACLCGALAQLPRPISKHRIQTNQNSVPNESQ